MQQGQQAQPSPLASGTGVATGTTPRYDNSPYSFTTSTYYPSGYQSSGNALPSDVGSGQGYWSSSSGGSGTFGGYSGGGFGGDFSGGGE